MELSSPTSTYSGNIAKIKKSWTCSCIFSHFQVWCVFTFPWQESWILIAFKCDCREGETQLYKSFHTYITMETTNPLPALFVYFFHQLKKKKSEVFFQFIVFSLLSRPQEDKHVLPASGPTLSSLRARFVKPTPPLNPARQSYPRDASTTSFSEDSSNAVWDFILASTASLSFWTRTTPKVAHSRANPASWHNEKLKTVPDTSYSVLFWLTYHSLPFLKAL